MSAAGTAPSAGAGADRAARARAAIAENPVWYHTLELAPGIATPGRIDLRRVAPRVLPTRMDGQRALDVGTFDGFWAFEMERRGAEVVALDAPSLESADWTPHARARLERESSELDVRLGRGFRLAADLLESAVERRTANVYELEPHHVGAPFDFAFVGALLLHLRDPVRALERLHGVVRPGGELRVMEPFSLRMLISAPRRPAARYQGGDSDMIWWLPNPAAIAAWIRTAGFETPRRLAVVRSGGERSMRLWHTVHSARRSSEGGSG